VEWVYLYIAIAFEILGTTCMKLSQGFTRPIPSVLLFVFYILCFGIFTLALRKLEVSVAYAIWCGVGMTGIAIVGSLFFGETWNPLKVVSIILILVGVVLLNLSGLKHS